MSEEGRSTVAYNLSAGRFKQTSTSHIRSSPSFISSSYIKNVAPHRPRLILFNGDSSFSILFSPRAGIIWLQQNSPILCRCFVTLKICLCPNHVTDPYVLFWDKRLSSTITQHLHWDRNSTKIWISQSESTLGFGKECG